MKPKRAVQSNLIEGARERLEATNEFQSKVEEIKRDVRDKYSPTISNEKNWTKRIFIVIKREIEIRRSIAELSSLKNLHVGRQWQI